MYRELNTRGGAAGCGHGFSRGGHPFHGRHHDYGNAWGGSFRRPKYNVPINIIETDAAYDVDVYATGFAKEEIKITVTDDLLYISGSRTIDEQNQPNFSRQEFPIKSFERVLNLNGKVDTSLITATQENGVLKITLPKTAEAQKPEQKIEVL
jgi:HSP20 family protein